MSDDATLLRQFASDRSESAFRELLRRHLPHVYSAARRLLNGDTHAAEDVSQRVFFDLATRATALRKTAVLSNWLHCRTRSLAKNLVRTNVRRRNRESEAAALWTGADGTGDAWARLSPLLDESLASLPQRDREVLLLRYYEKRDLRSVGQSLGISNDTAQKRVCRALDRLRGILMSRGLALSATVVASCLAENAIGEVPAGLASRVGAAIETPAVAAAGHGNLIPHAKACCLGLAAACAVGGIITGWWPVSSPAADSRRPLQSPATATNGIARSEDAGQPEQQLKPGAKPEEILARLRRLAALPETRRNRESLNSLLDLIPGEAWPEIAAKIEATSHRELWSRCLPGIIQRWGDLDPRAAIAFCMAHSRGESPWEREFTSAFLAWHPADPASALDGLSSAARDVASEFGRWPFIHVKLSDICLPLVKSLPHKLDDFVESVADVKAFFSAQSTVKDVFVSDLSVYWPELPPERFLQWLPAFTSAESARIVAGNLLLNSLKGKSGPSPPDAGALANQLVLAGDGFRSDVAPAVAIAWSFRDEAAASAWMNEALTPGERQKAANMVASSALNDAERINQDASRIPTAMNWTAAFADPASRERTLARLYHAWNRLDAKAAESFLQGTGWPAEQIARIQSGGQISRHP
jgi:RNA polymerase sigma factor (sigma-70 family)